MSVTSHAAARQSIFHTKKHANKQLNAAIEVITGVPMYRGIREYSATAGKTNGRVHVLEMTSMNEEIVAHSSRSPKAVADSIVRVHTPGGGRVTWC